MDDKLKAWLERLEQPPADGVSYEEFLEMLVECRILEPLGDMLRTGSGAM